MTTDIYTRNAIIGYVAFLCGAVKGLDTKATLYTLGLDSLDILDLEVFIESDLAVPEVHFTAQDTTESVIKKVEELS